MTHFMCQDMRDNGSPPPVLPNGRRADRIGEQRDVHPFAGERQSDTQDRRLQPLWAPRPQIECDMRARPAAPCRRPAYRGPLIALQPHDSDAGRPKDPRRLREHIGLHFTSETGSVPDRHPDGSQIC